MQNGARGVLRHARSLLDWTRSSRQFSFAVSFVSLRRIATILSFCVCCAALSKRDRHDTTQHWLANAHPSRISPDRCSRHAMISCICAGHLTCRIRLVPGCLFLVSISDADCSVSSLRMSHDVAISRYIPPSSGWVLFIFLVFLASSVGFCIVVCWSCCYCSCISVVSSSLFPSHLLLGLDCHS
ncbi:hypothetical protein IQ07DRAFT_304603 [Pyrenochaeta sp. DS3sAY3a]|nr:hypothetical protein IQ07DRAFT_304603 [Pyrenochaeta sp. DS3sAY3a]